MTSARTPDPFAPRQVLAATGLLADFNRARVLEAADVHVARRLAALGGEPDERVLLAAALAVRGVRLGSVCVDLAAAHTSTAVEGVEPDVVAALPWPDPAGWVAAVEASALVTVGSAPAHVPLRMVDGLLYLDRYWRQERVVADWVDAAFAAGGGGMDAGSAGAGAATAAALARLFPSQEPDLQRLAAAVAASRCFSILAGGPGTGKTWTVAKILALLQAQAGGGLRIALAAPTGKAAARLQQALREAVADPGFPADLAAPVAGLTASTLHRLLGTKPGTTSRFLHDRGNRLAFDVVVVDEASMVSLTLMSRLVEALRPDCRLLLVGDPDQLASIEVGAVLGDLFARPTPGGGRAGAVPLERAGMGRAVAPDLASLGSDERGRALAAGVVRLTKVRRFSEEIQAVAEAIRTGDPEVLRTAIAAAGDSVEFHDADAATAPVGALAGLRGDVVDAGRSLMAAAHAGRGEEALAALGHHQVLCAHRAGPHGVAQWGRRVEAWLAEAIPGYGSDGEWYVGRPLMITANDYQVRLFNGDAGVVVDDGGQHRAAFVREGKVELFAPSRLAEVQTVHALSIHRSQGSQYERVTVVLPPASSPLMTRELLYTAVTRAKKHVRILGTWESLAAAAQRPIVRASGLRRRVEG